MKSKYVVGQIRGEVAGNQQLVLAAIIFPETVVHSHVGKRLCYGVESAGFVDVFEDETAQFSVGIRCFGRSESLNKDSNPERDELLVRQALGLTY